MQLEKVDRLRKIRDRIWGYFTKPCFKMNINYTKVVGIRRG